MDSSTISRLGFATAFKPVNILFCFIGVLLGTLIGVLPASARRRPSPCCCRSPSRCRRSTSLIMLAGIYYGAQYGGSTTAILINLPGESSSAVTAIDGYQMARQGRAGRRSRPPRSARSSPARSRRS